MSIQVDKFPKYLNYSVKCASCLNQSEIQFNDGQTIETQNPKVNDLIIYNCRCGYNGYSTVTNSFLSVKRPRDD